MYNGKELESGLGLEWSYYGARMCDFAIGRFTGVDPKADQFAWVSPYNYAEDEPVGGLDLWGLQRADFNTYSDPGVQEYLRSKGRYTLTKEEDELVNGPSRDAGEMALTIALLVTGVDEVAIGVYVLDEVVVLADAAAAAEEVGFFARIWRKVRKLFRRGGKKPSPGMSPLDDVEKVATKRKGGRAKNKLRPDESAKGDHSVFKRDDNGDIYISMKPMKRHEQGMITL